MEYIYAEAGGEAYLKYGTPIPDETWDICDEADAIYFGAVGLLPEKLKPGIAERALLEIRFHYDQYVNLRPTKLYRGLEEYVPLKREIVEKGIDFVVVRENTEGAYAQQGGILRGEVPGEVGDCATNIMLYSKKGVERIVRYAFEYAKRHGLNRVTCVDKANVLAVSQYWRSIFDIIKKEYPSISTDYAYIDAMTQWVIRAPHYYQVIVTENLFGDILSDLCAPLAGSLGMMPGGNINPDGKSMFEPIHGSAPKYAGKNVANPIATILAGKMMLEEAFGMEKEAKIIDDAVQRVILEGKVRTYDICGKKPGEANTTGQMGDAIAEKVKEIAKERLG